MYNHAHPLHSVSQLEIFTASHGKLWHFSRSTSLRSNPLPVKPSNFPAGGLASRQGISLILKTGMDN